MKESTVLTISVVVLVIAVIGGGLYMLVTSNNKGGGGGGGGSSSGPFGSIGDAIDQLWSAGEDISKQLSGK